MTRQGGRKRDQYKIGKFCMMLGISADTLRYYERRGLLRTDKDPQTMYRTFSREDALAIWDAHMLRSLDLSIEGVRSFIVQGGLEDQLAWLSNCEATLDREISYLVAKKDRMRQLSALYTAISEAGSVSELDNMDGCYSLYVLGDGCRPSDAVIGDMPGWVSSFPFTYVAVGVTEENLFSKDEPLILHVGLGILESNVEISHIVPPPDAAYVSGGKALTIAVETDNVFSVTREDLAPLFAYAKERGIRLTGPLLGRVLYTVYDNESPRHVIAFSIHTA